MILLITFYIGSGSRARVLPEVIKNRGDLLEKYLDHRAESELQALYAIQSLVHKLEHPQGIIFAYTCIGLFIRYKTFQNLKICLL